MSRIALALSLPLLAVFLTALWLSVPPERLAARFSPSECRRVTVEAPGIGALTGIEDIALLPDGQAVLSADDRGAVDGALSGLFFARVADLTGSGSATALPIGGLPGVSRPHGIALDPSGTRLAYVNRPAPGESEVIWGRLEGARFRSEGQLGGSQFCRANDLDFLGSDLLVTLDRGDCGTSLADLVPGSMTGRLMRIRTAAGTADLLDARFAFANGIVAGGLDPLVAETRGARLTRLSGAALPVPGGPDNLTTAPEGRVVVALLPDLLRFALYSAGLASRAPSRIALADPATGTVEVLHDDPEGQIFSGATVAVMAGDAMIAGSAMDSGLLVCGGRG